MSLQIVGLGSECVSGASSEELMSQGQLQGALLWSYLGPGAEGAPESTLHPPFMEYSARVFNDVSVTVRDCPDWELLDSEWTAVRKAVEKADIVVVKFCVSDKQTFSWLRGVFGPRLRPLVRHCGVPVVLVAVGARLNDEAPPCSCPLCVSDWRHCVPHSEGLALSRELGATYLELPSLNHVFVGRYFGSVLEYFMIQCLKHKAKDRHEKRRGNKLHDLRPPHLEQPARLPPIRVEESSFCQDLQWLLERGVHFADVAFFSSDSGQELGWGHAAVLCAASPYFRSLLLGPKTRERPQSRCVCRDSAPHALRDPAPHSLMSCEAAIVDDTPPRQTDALLSSARLARLVVKDPLLCVCLWETLMFIYRGAWEWEHLQEALEEKLKNPLAVAQLLERIRSLLGRDRSLRDTPSARAAQLGPQTLVNLFNSPLYSDVIFMVQGSVLPAHRAVLVARCDVMAAMFSGKYAEARSRVVPIHGVSSDTFLSFLEYLYTDSCCPASVLQAMAVLVCAEMYQVKRLQHLCEVCVCAYLQSMPSRELASTGISVVRLLRRAKCHNAEQLYVWLLHFIANNYLIFSHKPDFLELSDAHIKMERTETGHSLDLSDPRSPVPPQTQLREEPEEPEDWSQDWEAQDGEPRAGGSVQLLHSDEETDECSQVHDLSTERPRTTKTNAKCDGEGKRKHECPICQKKLGRKQELKRHMLLHTGEKPFSCPVCEKRFIQKSNLKSHIVTHLDSVDTIIRHQKASEVIGEERGGAEEEQKRGAEEEEWRGAEEEQKRGAEEEEWRGAEDDKLTDQLSDSDNEEDWPQTMEGPCSSSAQQEEGDGSALERLSFLLNQALNESKERGQTSVYQCPICDKVFGRMENLRRHILVHTGEKAFSCPVCNKQFTLKQHLKLHMVLHTRDKQFSCLVCSKTFIRKDNLRSHMRIHSADRPFGCSECGARFFSDQDLERHKTVHTAERPFVCSVCKSSFLTRRHLTRHEKIHKKETQKPD